MGVATAKLYSRKLNFGGELPPIPDEHGDNLIRWILDEHQRYQTQEEVDRHRRQRLKRSSKHCAEQSKRAKESIEDAAKFIEDRTGVPSTSSTRTEAEKLLIRSPPREASPQPIIGSNIVRLRAWKKMVAETISEFPSKHIQISQFEMDLLVEHLGRLFAQQLIDSMNGDLRKLKTLLRQKMKAEGRFFLDRKSMCAKRDRQWVCPRCNVRNKNVVRCCESCQYHRRGNEGAADYDAEAVQRSIEEQTRKLREYRLKKQLKEALNQPYGGDGYGRPSKKK